jgi:3-isopropylmalate/(R)-2-methylmalate dehydratase small subunit
MSHQPQPSATAISHPSGRACRCAGDDIDTDRSCRHDSSRDFVRRSSSVFVDDRARRSGASVQLRDTPGASILGERNFGCGSSREHAPQGLMRAGIVAVVGESFSEIFQGNAAMIGMPCFAADHQSIDRLQTLIESAPETIIAANVEDGSIAAGDVRLTATLPPALRDAFLSGQWNPTAMLLDRFEQVQAVADRLPYIRGF